MTRPRKALISLADTPYYHITSRCVRRAFLCGVDHYSGKNYEHRRQWVVDRIRLLSSLFAIDVCAYAVMNNHYHLVLKICPEQIEEISDNDVMDRWCALFKGPLLIQRYRDGEDLKSFERTTVAEIVNVWRSKLASISWFMRCLNQPIAHQANREDNCTGKFWESRLPRKPLNRKRRCSPAWPMSTSTQYEPGSLIGLKPPAIPASEKDCGLSSTYNKQLTIRPNAAIYWISSQY